MPQDRTHVENLLGEGKEETQSSPLETIAEEEEEEKEERKKKGEATSEKGLSTYVVQRLRSHIAHAQTI